MKSLPFRSKNGKYLLAEISLNLKREESYRLFNSIVDLKEDSKMPKGAIRNPAWVNAKYYQ
jgi:hypothetical protein